MEFTNEPIVDEAVFQKVQVYLASIATHAKPPREKHQYTGLVCDKDLGFCIRLRKTKQGVPYFAFAATPKEYEGSKQLLLSELETELRTALNREKERAEKITRLIREEGDGMKESILLQMQDAFQKRAYTIAECQQDRMEMYKQFSSGEISEAEMKAAEDKYQSMVAHMETAFQNYFEKVGRIETEISENNPWLRLFRTWEPNLPFDKETLQKFVSCITLDHMQISSIEFVQAEWYKELPEDWRD